jgi:hypothetical protein
MNDLLLNTCMIMDSMSSWIEGDENFYERVGGQLGYLDTMVIVAESLEDWVNARPERNDWEDTAGWDFGIENFTAKVYLVSKETPTQFSHIVEEQISEWIEWDFGEKD